MEQTEGRGPRMIALAMLGSVLFNFPILALFNVPGTLLGVPILYAYIFLAWALLIGLMDWVVEKRS